LGLQKLADYQQRGIFILTILKGTNIYNLCYNGITLVCHNFNFIFITIINIGNKLVLHMIELEFYYNYNQIYIIYS